jgi:DNA-binding transcriptional MerR regulator
VLWWGLNIKILALKMRRNSMGGYMSVKEFSELSGIESSTLRFWEEEGLFKPARRDEKNGYRYYLANQVFETRFIEMMVGFKVPHKTILEMREDVSPESMDQLLARQEIAIGAEIRRLQDKQAAIYTKRKLVRQGERIKLHEQEISMIEREETRCLIAPRNEYETDGEGFMRVFAKFYKEAASSAGFNINHQISWLTDNWAAFLKTPGQPNYFFALDSKGQGKIKAGKYVRAYTRGCYGEFGDLPQRMDQYMRENKVKPVGPVDCIYLFDEACVKDATDYLVQVSVAVK